ncbi:MAG: hypothetical protein ABI216_02475 [Devosia sp.]
MEKNIGHMALWQKEIRADFFQVIVNASVNARADDARRLARLSLNLCHDAYAYPFNNVELKRINNLDCPLAVEFISNDEDTHSRRGATTPIATASWIG